MEGRAPTRYERFIDAQPTWLLALWIFSPGWVYAGALLGDALGLWKTNV